VTAQPRPAGVRAALPGWAVRAERAADRHLSAVLRRRPGWVATVSPYISDGTTRRANIRARVLLRRREAKTARVPSSLVAGLRSFLTVELPDEEVGIEVAGEQVSTTADPEGYVAATVELAGVAPGWHQVTFTLPAEPGYAATGRLLIVDPAARLGIVSDIDDTILHTGLTSPLEAIRTTFFTAESARRQIAGTPELYRALAARRGELAQIFYVSTGSWNLHAVIERFLARHRYPHGPVLMTDWGPGARWLFREQSAEVKARVITALFDEHPQLTWVLVGDSGQDDAEAYAAVARARPAQVRAIYLREVPGTSGRRGALARRLATELAAIGVQMRLVAGSTEIADHALGLGLIDAAAHDEVHRVVRAADAEAGRLRRPG
jgi:phosphatidate phosphatase APP1